ncbi:hypothetical protein JB92DRAFT_3114099 [Gautieria morchelliformis]|nr:hypothetical protein JB92DRAFT_3114099 [Gautieria morchelliformis]
MWSTHRLLDGHVHKPLIRFLGKRLPSANPQLPHPHPLAPPDIASRFSSKGHASHPTPKSPGHPSAGSTSFKEFWEAPARFWAPSREVGPVEIEAVLSGGASLT